jgi:uracil-DNA glycosylase
MSLMLDPRRQAMLEAMGVRTWTTPGTSVEAPSPRPRPAPTPATAMHHDSPRPAADAPRATLTPAPGSPPSVALGWGELQKAVADCQACGLCKHRKRTVFGTGRVSEHSSQAPRVDWLLVGEAPGEQEDLAGEPFVGQAGKLLDNILGCLGLSRGSAHGGGLYIANTLKCRPPANRNPSPEETALCAPWLTRQIELLQPRIIVAMGRFAAQSLLRQSVPDVEKIPLGKLRLQVHRHMGIPVVVTYHPAYLLRNLPDKARAWEDWVLAQQQVQAS